MRIPLAPILIAMTLTITGCSIKQTVAPATLSNDQPPEICLIPAEGLRAGFNTTYTAQLRSKGFQTREVAAGSPPSVCTLSTTYIGKWTWDMALYMYYADIRVYEQGRQVGQAEYDASWGGGRLDKFIDAQNKIIELTDQLFPNPVYRASTPPAASSNAPPALDKAAYKKKKLEQLMQESTSYDDYQKRYREILAE
ncbi:MULTISPECIES: Sbal_3080 family lipoprotein [Pseudomonas]|uniref:Sbal_3080 family lipoprotein n=1 Tax=Pseudomonas TaxID=286 RepID=UPI000281D197|nr:MULTISPECIES: Sbal_3080 family lipoprotein [Pseudomonas]MDQ0669178.1 hypothetical protein [Pseudomonas sp. W2I6]NVZ17050.1 hypothetical protein [Pseudomonas sp. IPO3775]NWA80651.1 hypothetical protein [Pseudomonas sp. C8002]NWB69751.1 hypothetical protein [Pseudomonas sp. I8001]PMU17539.1 hypothetical protein C1X90_26070 [Pseudomonas sp. GP01-A9]|eukprot:gene10664-16406_t